LGQASGWFDQVVVDDCPKWHQWRGLWRLVRLLNGWRADGQPEKRQRFDFIYDLQTSGRSGLYHRLLLPPKPSWSGIAAGASHRHDAPSPPIAFPGTAGGADGLGRHCQLPAAEFGLVAG
jgi:hypothetical protein